jgi:hypothetical protein
MSANFGWVGLPGPNAQAKLLGRDNPSRPGQAVLLISFGNLQQLR